MFMNLAPGAIGVNLPLGEVVKLAHFAGFEGVEINIPEVAKLAEEKSIAYVKDILQEADIVPGGWSLPVGWRSEESEFSEDLQEFPALAEWADQLNSKRAFTWIESFSDKYPFKENFAFHVKRLKPVAEVLHSFGCSLGLEFLGPKTLRDNHPYEFIHTLEGMLQLAEAISKDNVGILLDVWHWYTSHGTLDDLKKLTPEQVVYVHINDAPKGITIDEQIDSVRCLPGETGVIDLGGFLQTLQEIGYQGPVTPEPFSEKVRQMSPEEAIKTTYEALSKVWQQAF